MTESKGKNTKSEKVEKNEIAEKPAKKATKSKTTVRKKTEEVVAEENVTIEEAASVASELTEQRETVEAVNLEIEEAPVDTTEKKPRKAKTETSEEVEEAVEAKSVTEPEAIPVQEAVTEARSAEKHVASNEEFDWDAFETEELRLSPRFTEYESLYDKTLSTVAVDEVVTGTVIQMTNREVVINIGYKSEGVVSLNEFRYNPGLKVGDTVEVYVESQEDKKGQLVLSHKKARALNSWDRVNSALEKDEIITGYIKCRTKGGMIVDVFGIEAFLPGSQIDVKPIRDYDVFVNKTMEFKVVKINQEFKNVVVSHKALIEAELEQQKKEIIAKLEKGQVLEGTVKNITSYGVFIDLGGVDGLIHITDLSWGRVNHPEEVVQLDQKLNVVILDFDDDKEENRTWS